MKKTNQKDKDFSSEIKDTIVIKSQDLRDLHIDIHKKTHEEDKRFLGATYDTVFTVSVTIAIFVFGIIADRLLKHFQEKKEQREYRSYFMSQLRIITQKIGPNLISGYKQTYQTEIGIDNGIPTTPPKILTNTFDRILNMESSKLFKSFTKNEKNKLNKLLSEIDFLSNLLLEINQYHNVVLQRSETTRNIISQLDYSHHRKLIDFIEFERVNNPNYALDPTYILITQKLDYYNEQIAGKRNLKAYYKNIVRPVQLQLVQNTNLFRAHPVGSEIAEIGKQFATKYSELKLLVTEVKLEYRKLTFSIKESLSNISSLIDS